VIPVFGPRLIITAVLIGLGVRDLVVGDISRAVILFCFAGGGLLLQWAIHRRRNTPAKSPAGGSYSE
jgi:hypothetical protein